MPKFTYSAIDSNGKQKTGSLNAGSEEEARNKLSSMGLMPTSVAEGDSQSSESSAKQKSVKAKKKSSGGFSLGKKVKQAELTTFTRQLATLLEAGLPLLRALEVMIRQERNERFKGVMQQIADQVKSGNSFSDGLSQHPKVFDRLYVNMIKAGEAGVF